MTFEQLFQLRIQGRRPDGAIVLSLSGPLRGLPANTIQFKCPRNPDVRGCADLDVILVHDGAKAQEAMELADLLIAFHVKNLICWIPPSKTAIRVVWEGQKHLREIEAPWL